MKTSRVLDTLPDLPPEVIEIIWEFVRIDLRPRMKRYGPLLRNIRVEAAIHSAKMHGRWLDQAYMFTHTQVWSSELMIQLILCAWKFLGLHRMWLELQSDDEDVALAFVEQNEPTENKIPHLVENRAFALWKRMPAPELRRCHAECPTHFAFGPPTPLA